MNTPTSSISNQRVALMTANERREQLLLQINADKRLPSLGVAISGILKIESTGQESINQLANYILSDVGLTKDILSLANSASYRSSQAAIVTTVSKAIFMLGFDVVKTTALSMVLVKSLHQNDQSLYYELAQALCASIIARECVKRSMYQDAEEASVAALFKNIGRILIAAESPALYQEMMQPVEQGKMTAHASAQKLIGCDLIYFGTLILQQWNMPASIAYAVAALPSGEIKKTKHRSEWIRQVASFSADAAEFVMRDMQVVNESNGNIAFEELQVTQMLMQRYSTALDLDLQKLPDLLKVAVAEAQHLIMKLGIRLDKKATLPHFQRPEQTQTNPVGHDTSAPMSEDKINTPKTNLPDDLLLSPTSKEHPENNRHPSGKPYNAREMLMAGMLEMTRTIANGKFQLNELSLQLLEVLQRGLGFQFVTISLKETKNERFTSRLSIGHDWERKHKSFIFPSNDDGSLFHVALRNNSDLVVSDINDARVKPLQPEWHRTSFPEVKSMMLLPLIVHGKAIGLIYADRHCVAPEGIQEEEVALVKTMKEQLLAMMSR